MVGTRWSDHPHIIRKGHRFLTCVVDHDTGRLVWAHEGRNKDTLTLFFDALGPHQIRSTDACLGRRRGMDRVRLCCSDYAAARGMTLLA